MSLSGFSFRDDERQAAAAYVLLTSLTVEEPGFIGREVVVELVCVLERAYGFDRDRIADVLDDLVSTEVLVMEAADDVAIGGFPLQGRWRRVFRSDDPGRGRAGQAPFHCILSI